jgi:hypothetical protein
VTAAHVRAIARGIFLVELHVGEQPRARVATFDQVVAENSIFGKAASQSALEGIDLVDPLAAERALLEEILVDV